MITVYSKTRVKLILYRTVLLFLGFITSTAATLASLMLA
jgi:hypothetical protein